MSKCSADETPVCCCMDVGTIMDNSDCTASYSRVFANRAEAEQTLAALTEKARSVESEPCKITPTFTEESDGVRLDIDFTFACEAEMLIFHRAARHLGTCRSHCRRWGIRYLGNPVCRATCSSHLPAAPSLNQLKPCSNAARLLKNKQKSNRAYALCVF